MGARLMIRIAAAGCLLDFATGVPNIVVAAVREAQIVPVGVFLFLREFVPFAIALVPLLLGIGLLRHRPWSRFVGLIYGGLALFSGLYTALNFSRFSANVHRSVGDFGFGLTIARIPLVVALGAVLLLVLTRVPVRELFSAE